MALTEFSPVFSSSNARNGLFFVAVLLAINGEKGNKINFIHFCSYFFFLSSSMFSDPIPPHTQKKKKTGSFENNTF